MTTWPWGRGLSHSRFGPPAAQNFLNFSPLPAFKALGQPGPKEEAEGQRKYLERNEAGLKALSCSKGLKGPQKDPAGLRVGRERERGGCGQTHKHKHPGPESRAALTLADVSPNRGLLSSPLVP